MNHTNKGKAKIFLELLCITVALLLTFSSNSIGVRPGNFHIHLTADTIPSELNHSGILRKTTIEKNAKPVKANAVAAPHFENIDTVPKNLADSSRITVADTFNIPVSRGALDVPVDYHADDSMIMSVPEKTLVLYGKKSTVNYGDNNMEAPQIEYNQKTNLVRAHLVKDSLGKIVAYAKIKQGEFESQSDTLVFDMQSKKGLTKGTYTKQGEMFVYGKTIKKVDDDVFYALKGRFTTCNLDTPHFAFVSSKIKFIRGKMAFTGPVHPEFEGVPVPIILPFGIYPLSQGRHSGLIAPSFSANDQMGLSLDGIGYYKILSPAWDAIVRGTIYSYGGWSANINPRYYKRYRYQGNVGFDIQQFKVNFKGDPDYSSSRTLALHWTHSTDSKARPGVSFNANVNAASSKYNEQRPNDPNRNFQNLLNSSITYSKVWKDYNLSVSANHNQNTVLRQINLNLPDINFNANTVYPFRRKEPVGEYKWFENLGIALNTTARSLTSFYDTAGFVISQMKRNLQWGASHSIPISLALPSLGPLQLAPSISYTEKWYDRRLYQNWNASSKKIDTTIDKGFFRAYDMSFSVSASTRIFGLFSFKKGKLQMRHEIRPSFSLSYKPDINGKYYRTLQLDSTGKYTRAYSVYESGIYGTYGQGRFGGMSFGIDNNLSMKVRDKKDTSANATKKVTLIDGFGITSSYNFLRDSFRLEPFNISARSNLFDKINITASAIVDPYRADSLGRRIDKLVWSEKLLTLGTLTTGYISMQTSFRGGDKKDDKSKTNVDNINQQNLNSSGLPLDEYQQELTYMNNNPGEFVDFTIPWDISLSYSARFSRTRILGTAKFRSEFNQDVNWNASLNLTEKWKIGVNGFYNITGAELGTISMFLSREMHCWQMAINISPVGRYKFFNITISPKSSILRDLKVNRTRSFYDL